MSRERYGGLYDWTRGYWLASNGDWEVPPTKRFRFDHPGDAKDAAAMKYRTILPRPFYVVRKPKKSDMIVEAACNLRCALGAAPYSWHKQQPDVYAAWKKLVDIL